MTPSELKYEVESRNPDRHFFERSTMRFFGDTMRNYGVRKVVLLPDGRDAYELFRRKPVKQGLKNSAYFDAETFKQILGGV